MWIPEGYIVHTGDYPITAKYLVYSSNDDKIDWTSETNDATIFDTIDSVEKILNRFNIKNYSIRLVARTDTAFSK